MINSIITYSVKNKLVIGLFTLAIIFVGLWSMTKVPIDAVPDITNNQVQVITQAPNLGTEDIEQFVTYPVEVALANLPGVTEIRSVSRFGLSLVTIVFDDDQGTYLPRQLVAEKLTQIQNEIPEGFGKPFIGPISTGLGEIYQYSLEIDSAFAQTYSLSELRSMQDWIIRRQMAMVPGVVEVNAFGGDIKQYEVAVSPEKLKSMGITISEIFNALQENNQNTGGAYIEKNHQAHYIRGEGMVESLEDIEGIVLKTFNGVPLRIKDVAKVQYGKAIKYGALTKDGKGEAVGGMILMLKGANSNEVIAAVKERMKKIQKSLPEGVTIEPFLDRSTLITSTIGTVSNNLVEGALIVIFILVFLLGNWRGGLIVASTIPLSLLFAFILMNVFDVWANLMSLGAIDFGIIIDGAVIIVEGTVFLMHDKLMQNQKIDTHHRDEMAIESSSKMMNSAFFGQLIILIVFIPILALQGVEGKMFQPMALTFMFAMIGVMILGLTYVPMMSSWFLRVPQNEKLSGGDRVVKWVENTYELMLERVMKNSKLVLTASLVLMALAVFSFSRMGGEFIPKIDEGDIAFHSILKPGSSLTETIATTTKIEKIIINNFPEVKHVICRIGVADVPTDPMPMDIADCFAILKPKSEWREGMTKEKLVNQIKEMVSVVPGINFEFTQPIEMRFNELLTGVREDVAVKLFGENLDTLAMKAQEMGQIIATVKGVADMKVEATKGLPQIAIKYNRIKLARYGLNVNHLNQLIQTAFAGSKAGVIFEGERRYDMVVHLDQEFRTGITDIQNLYVGLENGNQVPLKEVADICYKPGPMQISRDNTNRRTYVGINVRGRDVKSVVTEIQSKLDEQLDLPSGYYIRYGGAFENLQRATRRLKTVIPIALALIFILIFFALKSVKQTLMIYIAIPLSAIGGVFSLWLRDMPFSISAGVGFIVLFGVAVLNGLVLISGWNEMKDRDDLSLTEKIRIGARRRIRPIMLTALTDILGFLPMAMSTSAGAEVQQPLATVVIGGMITATFLTLFVLPIIYRWMEQPKKVKVGITTMLLLFVGISPSLMAQTNSAPTVIHNLNEVIALGIANNGNLIVAHKNVQVAELQKKSALNLGKTDVLMRYGQYNSYQNDFAFEINQNIEFPSVYAKQKNLAKALIKGSEAQVAISKNDLVMRIKQSWYQLSYLQEQSQLLQYKDSIYTAFTNAAKLRYETEESTYLEWVNAESQTLEVRNEIQLLQSDIAILESNLRLLINDKVGVYFKPTSLQQRQMLLVDDSSALANNPGLRYAQQQINLAQAQKEVSLSKALPNLKVGYFNQSMIGNPLSNGDLATGSNRFSGIQAGISIPLFYGSYKADVKTNEVQRQSAEVKADYYKTVLQNQYEMQLQQVLKYQHSLNYYQTTALNQADLILENAQSSYTHGAIGYLEYFQSLQHGLKLKLNYLETLNGYNQAIIDLEFLLGNK